MIQQIREANSGAEHACDIPEGWQAGALDGWVFMTFDDGPAITLLRSNDGTWRAPRDVPA